MDGLQLLQGRLPAADALEEQTRSDAANTDMCACVCERDTPHTGLGGPARAAWTRCSGPSQRVRGADCCPRRYTGASAFENHKPGLHTQISLFFLESSSLISHFPDGGAAPTCREAKL